MVQTDQLRPPLHDAAGDHWLQVGRERRPNAPASPPEWVEDPHVHVHLGQMRGSTTSEPGADDRQLRLYPAESRGVTEVDRRDPTGALEMQGSSAPPIPADDGVAEASVQHRED